MYPPRFEYTAPDSLEEALALIDEHGDDAKLLAGGQSLIPLLKLRFAAPAVVVDLGRIHGGHALQHLGVSNIEMPLTSAPVWEAIQQARARA